MAFWKFPKWKNERTKTNFKPISLKIVEFVLTWNILFGICKCHSCLGTLQERFHLLVRILKLKMNLLSSVLAALLCCWANPCRVKTRRMLDVNGSGDKTMRQSLKDFERLRGMQREMHLRNVWPLHSLWRKERRNWTAASWSLAQATSDFDRKTLRRWVYSWAACARMPCPAIWSSGRNLHVRAELKTMKAMK